jgi:hypothetical protein
VTVFGQTKSTKQPAPLETPSSSPSTPSSRTLARVDPFQGVKPAKADVYSNDLYIKVPTHLDHLSYSLSLCLASSLAYHLNLFRWYPSLRHSPIWWWVVDGGWWMVRGLVSAVQCSSSLDLVGVSIRAGVSVSEFTMSGAVIESLEWVQLELKPPSRPIPFK